MTEVSGLLKIIYNFIEDDSIEEEALSYLQFAIENAENHSWPILRKSLNVTSTSSGVLVPPPRCREILSVTSEKLSTGVPSYEFHVLDAMPTAEEARQNNYWMVPYVGLDTDEANYTVAATQGSATITQVSGENFFVTGDVGKSITLVGSSQEYEILSYTDTTLDTITVSPEVSIETNSNASATLMYAGRDRYQLYTPDMVPFEGTVTMTYQRWHPEVWGWRSKLLIPCPQSVVYLALQMFQQTNKYDVDAERLQRKLDAAIAREIYGAFFSKRKKPVGSTQFSVRSRRS